MADVTIMAEWHCGDCGASGDFLPQREEDAWFDSCHECEEEK